MCEYIHESKRGESESESGGGRRKRVRVYGVVWVECEVEKGNVKRGTQLYWWLCVFRRRKHKIKRKKRGTWMRGDAKHAKEWRWGKVKDVGI